jgi:hypothetical protein
MLEWTKSLGLRPTLTDPHLKILRAKMRLLKGELEIQTARPGHNHRDKALHHFRPEQTGYLHSYGCLTDRVPIVPTSKLVVSLDTYGQQHALPAGRII